ncbi:MAG TPA: hypothetical protein VMW08_00520 [Acidimicrobiales bacterium]|nr:hypothetical protein [Acidimicrobiales bacterium]
MTFEEWLTTGIAEGWCSEPGCAAHDGPPLTEAEAELYNAHPDDWPGGFDPLDRCLPVVRLFGPDGPEAVPSMVPEGMVGVPVAARPEGAGAGSPSLGLVPEAEG